MADKTGCSDFARFLTERGIEILSTGGTARHLEDAGVAVTRVENIVGFPHLLGGRVKTLAPHIHAAILADREDPKHLEELDEAGIQPIDLVAVDLYPFERALAANRPLPDLVEEVDIGGVTLLRSAAKNHAHVVVASTVRHYAEIQQALDTHGQVPDEVRRRLAYEAFLRTAQYDALISTGLGAHFRSSGTDLPDFPERLAIPLSKAQDLRYGENHHQAAAFYRDLSPSGYRRTGFANAEQLHGKALSYNNILDGEEAIIAVREFADPTLVIIKHATPSGVASAPNLLEAWEGAYNTDTYSPFGGIVAANRTIDLDTAKAMREIFLEMVIAPGFTEDALGLLRRKKNLRLVRIKGLDQAFVGPPGATEPPRLTYRSVSGGLLVQAMDLRPFRPEEWSVVTARSPSEQEMRTMLFAARVVKHVRSNAVVFAKGTRTVGIGGGQTARVDASLIACHKGGENIRGSVMASDAFFPFRDAVDVAAENGVKAIVQPGGSIRDEEVFKAADEHGIAMVTTGHRLFHH